MQYTLQACGADMCVFVCPFLSTSHDPREDQAVAALPIDCVGTRHLGFQQLINQARSWHKSLSVCVFLCVGLSRSSQQERKRQPHDNVTSPPFIPATQHSETKQQQPGNQKKKKKKAAWFTADMTSITNTNPFPSPGSFQEFSSCPHLHSIQSQKNTAFIRGSNVQLTSKVARTCRFCSQHRECQSSHC